MRFFCIVYLSSASLQLTPPGPENHGENASTRTPERNFGALREGNGSRLLGNRNRTRVYTKMTTTSLWRKRRARRPEERRVGSGWEIFSELFASDDFPFPHSSIKFGYRKATSSLYVHAHSKMPPHSLSQNSKSHTISCSRTNTSARLHTYTLAYIHFRNESICF